MSVKLVAGVNIGTIAVGVAKAGADIIQISGGEGGTGAASLSSMKHAGLPWEIGLLEAHQALMENNLREHVLLRTDGGLSTGRDIVIAALLGAQEFDFGKFLLIAEGCVMARICEKNTCPRGIATHDPKFKAKYRGKKEHIVAALSYLAEDVRRELKAMGASSLEEIIGRVDRLVIDEDRQEIIRRKKLDLSFFLNATPYHKSERKPSLSEPISPFNHLILDATAEARTKGGSFSGSFEITNTDRSSLATLFGTLAQEVSHHRFQGLNNGNGTKKPHGSAIHLDIRGSAGQSFAVFQTEGVTVRLTGEANDSLCKSMSGGKTVLVPPEGRSYDASEHAITGNCTLYGATGGTLYVYGQAGDRFAVRNSGAVAVVEGTGLHACEYMTNGLVVNLGPTAQNIGAGMTGGEIYLFEEAASHINAEYITETPLSSADEERLRHLLDDYCKETGSTKAKYILADWESAKDQFRKFVPKAVVQAEKEDQLKVQ